MSLQSLLARVRLEFNDIAVPFQYRAQGDGETRRFALPVTNVNTADFHAFIDGVGELEVTTDYELSAQEGVLTLAVAPAADELLVVQGTAHEHFSDSELTTFATEAFLKHAHGQIPPQTLTDPPPTGYVALPAVEYPIVAILATIDALWALATNAAFDINVTTAEGTMIPAAQRFQQILMLIQMLEERYRTLAQALNVGLHRIQMFDLRRRSRTTNRLVPLYLEQEYDDLTYPPTRVLPPIDPKVL